jgi:hypothetical protein
VKNSERPQNKNLLPPLKKGHAPLPGGGRPKGVKSWSVIMREAFERGEITQEDILKAHMKKAKDGDSKSFEIIMDRMDGKAMQPIRMSGEMKTIKEVDESELRNELGRIEDSLVETEKGHHPRTPSED